MKKTEHGKESEAGNMTNTCYGIESVRRDIGADRYEHDFGLFRKELILALMVELDRPPDPMADIVDRAVESIVHTGIIPTAKSHVPPVHLMQITDAAFSRANKSDDPDRCYALCGATGPALSKPRLFSEKTAAQDAMATEWAQARGIEIDETGGVRRQSPRDRMLDVSFGLWESGDRSAQFRSMDAWTGSADERRSWRIFEMRASEREGDAQERRDDA